MKFLEFEIQINATPEKVWETLLTQDSYKKWASAMNEGTYFEGNWEVGSIMKFLDPQNNGMYNLVTETIRFKVLGM